MRKSFAAPTIDSLVDLACRDGVDIRPTLLRVLTDLYVQKATHSAEEEVQYVELTLGLIDTVDAPTRAAVASRLASYRAAPSAILRRLQGDLPVVEVAQAKAEPDLAELFFAASPIERRLILTNLDPVAGTIKPRLPAERDMINRLENAALQHNTDEFSCTLQQALGISGELAERITGDSFGEPVVVAAKALGMKAAVLQRILLFLNPQIGQSVARVYDLAQLYDELTPATAERMLTIWLQADGQRKPRHESLHWDDMNRSARSYATHTGYRTARSRKPISSRFHLNDR